MGARIADARRSHHLTQESLAEMLDVSIKHISAVERGKSSLSLEKLNELCGILDVTLDYLVTGSSLILTSSALPKSILEILQSQDPEEIELFMEYVRLYQRLREHLSGKPQSDRESPADPSSGTDRIPTD